jgi:hypothetical protein
MVTVTATISPVVTVIGEAVVPTVTAVDVKAPRTAASAIPGPAAQTFGDSSAVSYPLKPVP